MQFDLSSISAVAIGTSTSFQNLWGAVEIDVDHNAATGKTPELDYPNMTFAHWVDYVIGFYYDDELGTAAILDVTRDQFFTLSAE